MSEFQPCIVDAYSLLLSCQTPFAFRPSATSFGM